MEEAKDKEANFSGEFPVTMGNPSESLSSEGPVKVNEANFSRESPLTMDNPSEALPNIGPPNISHHEENVVIDHYQGATTNEQQESVIEKPELFSDVTLLGQDTVTDEIDGRNHQEGLNLKDSANQVEENGSMSIQNQLREGASVELVDAQIIPDLMASNSSREIEVNLVLLPNKLNVPNNDGRIQKKAATELASSAKPVKKVSVNSNRGIVDTAAPFESVKEAVTKFGGIVDWKAHKKNTLEKRKLVQLELERIQAEVPESRKQSEAAEESKVQVLEELDRTNRIVEELKLNLEKAQTEEAQAKQDLELAQLRVKEMEQGIANESSVAAKAQREVAKTRHEAAVAELKTVNTELESLRGEYISLVNERDVALKNAKNATYTIKEIEKTAEELTLELITSKESLELAHAAHLEAEEHRIGASLAREQDCLAWEKELKDAEEEVKQLNHQLSLTKDLKSKLETASSLLFNLKAELSSYMESKLNQESETTENKLPDDLEETKKTQDSIQLLASTKKEIEEVKASIVKAKDEVACLRVAASSLKSELDKERASLVNLQQREAMASIAVSSLESELDRTKQDLEVVRLKEKAAREKMVELPKLLQQAAQEADEAKTAAQMAREELRKSKEEADQAKASASTIDIRLHAALKEIEAAKASERLALAAIKALQESEQAASICADDSPHSVTLPLDEYFNLSKRAHEAEELAHERITAAIAQIEVAKQSEQRSLERLNEALREMELQKETFSVATEQAEKAKEGKLGAEQELRKWRAEHERRRRASNDAKGGVNPQRITPKTLDQPSGLQSFTKSEKGVGFNSMADSKQYISEDGSDNGVSEVKTRKKKKLFVPTIGSILGQKKSQPIK
ncbi:protein WEAK CHLOROPLAST MOVEMENT UNDER BLUE LIGHT 1-like [Curcuma longa]|uniref:protein WEAK CHLOROPLAST MOVEMENT UNDER BLUE LIGHT 1-like n=1 Tax=Curcuma longa TaxID=136217 RepID=UPI003D9F56E4